MRRILIAATAASLLTLAACAAETRPADSSREAPSGSVQAPAPDAAADLGVDAELESITIDVMGMG